MGPRIRNLATLDFPISARLNEKTEETHGVSYVKGGVEDHNHVVFDVYFDSPQGWMKDAAANAWVMLTREGEIDDPVTSSDREASKALKAALPPALAQLFGSLAMDANYRNRVDLQTQGDYLRVSYFTKEEIRRPVGYLFLVAQRLSRLWQTLSQE